MYKIKILDLNGIQVLRLSYIM